ncbi:MAG: PHP domain-containing protein [Fidelibacterota bacterium]|nr:MAG: PHP domain-containing protein [Candidatus Neomarinimicrobiota bacterium]
MHIHSCLSPCAELEMSPRNIIEAALKSGLDIIGICDHNSCENVPYVKKSGENAGVLVKGGMEVTSKEEVHILAFIEDDEHLFTMQELIYEHLYGTNDDRLYGDQVIVNEDDEVMGFNRRLLIGAADLSVEDIVAQIHEFNGLAIASHIDRDSFSIISQLGFVPEGLQIDAYEVSNKNEMNTYTDDYSPLVTFSDAHKLQDIGKQFSHFYMDQATLEEMGKALNGENGRQLIL